MNRFMRWAVTIPALLALAATAGCSRPLKDQVVGNWKETNGTWQLSFLKDGTFTSQGGPKELGGAAGSGGTMPSGGRLRVGGKTPGIGGDVSGSGGLGGGLGGQLPGVISGALNSIKITGSYTTPDEKTLKIQPQGIASMLGPMVWPTEVKDKRLTLDINGKKTEFQKVD